MNVNPIGINTYQNVSDQARTAEKKNDQQPVPTRSDEAVVNEVTTSRLAVKAPKSSYADFLSTEERQALDVLFKRYNDNSRAAEETKSDAPLGSIIDIKV
ncbi:MAG: hypothetical protein ACOYVF_08760 [Candidatus Zixiibacteriota bacterium]